jgi:tRNA pseudouridine55 synthase
MTDGLLPINKPVGMSSFDVIRVFKRSTGFKGKIGHAGTLDVFANGVMILMLGSATKSFDSLQDRTKSYRASARLGYSSSTLDIEGALSDQANDQRTTYAEIINATQKWIGEFEQDVPFYSAAKQNGQPLYKLARAGKRIIPKSKPVKIEDISIVAYKYPLVTFDVTCSSGTYIRQLGLDLFHELGLESFLFALTRIKVGNISLSQCCELEHLNSDRWQEFVLEVGSL